MSQNNQVLLKQYKGKWYVWNNIMAESWSEDNEISLKHAKCFDTKEEALDYAFEIDKEINEIGLPNSEYGVQIDELAKDEAKVTIINDE